jgi:hypothetical protein
MEFMLLLWDEWDDFTGACRHLATSTASELTGISASLAAPVTTAVSAVGVWFSTFFRF